MKKSLIAVALTVALFSGTPAFAGGHGGGGGGMSRGGGGMSHGNMGNSFAPQATSVRDHRGSSQGEGGVSVTNTPGPNLGRHCGESYACGASSYPSSGTRDHRTGH
jgi:hypothetical protein